MSEEQTLMEFPCQFPIKAMGKNDESFNSLVVGIISQHAGLIQADCIQARLSGGDKYVSITVTIDATSREQLDAIYQGLTDCPEVLMAL